ncbi:hypothetical protein Zmor_009050 [Zophobas morio]|jgi:guanine nucleotide-binding protein subunit beta-2-like 1 protein|uniref:Small ribosomal subunit protein RACK1 n=1 Tax=Zophobas morio TaxID=2755281 RepID=A0AA38M0Z5_9CUCU|nr:hypothetical protein Zmor_009050 [Zophobas morio]
MAEKLSLIGILRGHTGWITQIASSSVDDLLISSSRDKTLIVWKIERSSLRFGYPKKTLTGHNHFVSDVVISSDGLFALSGSWDKTLRLWDLTSGETRKIFQGHKHDVLSVAFSSDHRHIVSGSRDRTIKLWNTLGECKYTMGADSDDSLKGHSDWVSCVTFNPTGPQVISCGWDNVVKVWELTTCQLRTNFIGHRGVINCVTVSPDGSLCASGGKDGLAMVWDLAENGNYQYTFEAGHTIAALCFSPSRYWLCAGAGSKIIIWDLGTKAKVREASVTLVGENKKQTHPEVISLCWSYNGDVLYAGYTDNLIRAWGV